MAYVPAILVIYTFGLMANDAFRLTFGMDGIEAIITMFALPLGAYLFHHLAMTPKGAIFTNFALNKYPLLLLAIPATAALLYVLFKGALVTSAGGGDWVPWSKYSAFLFLSFPVVALANVLLARTGVWDDAADILIRKGWGDDPAQQTNAEGSTTRETPQPATGEFKFDPGRFGK